MSGEGIDALLARMEADLVELERERDARRYFHATYLRTTRAVVEEIDRGGFADGDWLRRWDLAFAELYLDALDADRRGEPVSSPWRVAFGTAARQPELPALRHVLFGLNAHINYDLPQALLAVISPADIDDAELLHRRQADHEHVDVVLQARVAAEDVELGQVSEVTRLDRLMRPVNRAASRRFLGEARAKVWRNTLALDRARRIGPEQYATVLRELEKRCAARVLDLTRPGAVLVTLAVRGFGVLVSDA